MATSTLGSGTLVLAGTTSGTTTVTATAVAGTTTLTLPAATDTLVGRATTDTLTNKTLTGAVMNGTLGATTPSTVSATTLTTSSTVTHNGGTANGVGYLNGSKVLTTGSALVFDGTNLGLGVTPSAWGSGVKAYQTTGSSFFVGDTRNYFATNVYLNSSYSPTYIASQYALQYYQDATAGTHAWYNSASGTAGNAISFTQAMTLDGSGNLLVGTTSSFSARLAVKDSTNNGTTNPIVCKNSSDTTLFYISSNGYFVTGTGANSPYNLTTASGANVTIESDGVLKRSTSSLKYKTDVQDATHGLAEVLQLRPVTYKGKNDGDKVFGGLIAEEVHEAGLTEFVQYAEDGSPDALAYGNMVSLLTKAIQEQQALITQLQADVAALKGA
jgi:hypothetical protein